MPIITVQFIKDVVATPEQKRELIVRLTDTFVDILGDVVRPFVYTIIQETPQAEWGIAGVPMPDLVYLTSDKHAQVIERSNELMRAAIAQMAAQSGGNGSQPSSPDRGRGSDEFADQLWRGEVDLDEPGSPRQFRSAAEAAAYADNVWRSGQESGQRGVRREYASKAEEHRALFERWFAELWNKKNYDIPYELVHPDFTAHGAGGQRIKQGPEGVIELVKGWHQAFPDGHMTIDDIITEGDISVIRMTWEATHLGQFGPIAPTGRRIKVTSTGIDRVIDGRITEGWGELDLMGMFMQMGVMPSPNPPTPEEEALNRNKAAVMRLNTALNSQDFDTFYELLDDNFVNHVGGETQEGVGEFVSSYEPFFAAMPDFHSDVAFMTAQYDRVATRANFTGTHKGNFMGIAPATGKTIAWTGLIIYRFNEDGKIVERWQDADGMGLMMQLGAISA
jgi:4-oxalocrotonate tautomerase